MKKTFILGIMTAVVLSTDISQVQASQASCFDGIGDRIESAANAARTFYNNLPNDDEVINRLDRFGRRFENTVNDVLDGDFVDEMSVRIHRWVGPQPSNSFSRAFQSATDSVHDVSRGLSHQLNRRFR